MVDRYISPCAPPEGYEREVLTILVEECAEVQKCATKMLRFGIEEVQPGQSLSCAYRLGLEIGDVLEMIDRAIEAGLCSAASIEAGRIHKRMQLAQFMQQRQFPEPNNA